MAGEVSFDVVSDFDVQELRNALDQARREVAQRYDFKGAHVEIEQGKSELTLVADDEFRAKAVRDIIESKALRRESVAQDLRLGRGRARRRQPGPAGGRSAAGSSGGSREEAVQADPRRVSKGQVADPGRCHPGLGQEQGRPAARDRAAAGARRAGAPAVPELPLGGPRRASREKTSAVARPSLFRPRMSAGGTRAVDFAGAPRLVLLVVPSCSPSRSRLLSRPALRRPSEWPDDDD